MAAFTEWRATVVPVIVIPACAGMDYINHWIPAFAGMTEGVDSSLRRVVEKGDDGAPLN